MTHAWAQSQNLETYFQPSVDSTNTWAKKDSSAGEGIRLYLTDHQTQGRGRHNRTWSDLSSGEILLSTWAMNLLSPPQPIFTVRVGLLLWASLQKAWPQLPFALKAPNDIYIGNGKLAGLLIEAEQYPQETRIAIGLGLNAWLSPSVEQQATCSLATQGADIEAAWAVFCHSFCAGLLELKKDAQRSQLTTQETVMLLTALSKYPDNPVAEVLRDGSLVLKNDGLVPWDQL